MSMKLRDSGMPDEAYWESLFDVPLVLARLGIDGTLGDVVELGCGYGTFSIPVARAIRGTLHSFDVDPAMVARTRTRASELPHAKLVCQLRDVMEQGFGVRIEDFLWLNPATKTLETIGEFRKDLVIPLKPQAQPANGTRIPTAKSQ